jgi:hypothetical protein
MTATIERPRTRLVDLQRSDGIVIRAAAPAPTPTQVPAGIASGRTIADRERNTAPAAAPIRRHRLG